MRKRSLFRVASVLMLVVALLAWAAPAAVGKAPPAPPAGRLVFGSDRDWATIPSSQIYAVNTDGTGLTKLTNFSWWAVFPAPSPDGTRIAFDGIQPEAAFGPGSKTFEFHGHAIFHSHDLYVMNADGSHVRRLTNGLSPATPAWSPDGTTVAVALRAPCPDPCNPSNIPPVSHIALMSPDGSGITQITSGPNLDWHPSWSPDGSRLAFERDFNDGSGNGAIDIVNRDGSGLRPVLVSSGTCCFSDPSWSPDGTKIAFWNITSSMLQVLDLGSGKVTALARAADLGINEFDVASATWSPDGQWLAVGADEFSNGTGVSLISADGKTIVTVPNGDLGADPHWLPR